MLSFLSKLTGNISIGAVLAGSAFALELPRDLLSNLASLQFRERESAQISLLDWARTQGEPAKIELLKQSRNAVDPEVRERCFGVLRDLVMDQYWHEGSGYIGVSMRSESANVPGDEKLRSVIRIQLIQPNTPAQRAGLLLNDLIVGLEGTVWYEQDASAALQEKIKQLKPFTKVRLKILREGKISDVIVSLMRRPVAADSRLFGALSNDPAAQERAAQEAFFREWVTERNLPK